MIGFVLNIVLGKYNNTPLHYGLQYNEVINKTVRANCIILGNSHATHSIRPSFLNTEGFIFYNLALNGSNPLFHLNWYTNILMPNYPTPKYCIFAVDWFMFDENYLWRRYEQDAINFPNNLYYKNLIDVKHFDTKMLVENRYPFFIHRSIAALEMVLKKAHGDDEYKIAEYDDGFVPWQVPYKKENFIPPANIISEVRLQNDFDSLIQIIKKNGTKIIFVSIPEFGIPATEYETKPAIIFIRHLTIKYNIPYLNYNIEMRSEINRDINNFIDWGHMSSEGSKKFSLKLKEDLKKFLR